MVHDDYDVVAISESWLDVFRNDRNSHGDGVLVAIKSDLCPPNRCDFSTTDHEIIWSEFTRPRGRVLIVC